MSTFLKWKGCIGPYKYMSTHANVRGKKKKKKPETVPLGVERAGSSWQKQPDDLAP